MAEFKKGDRIRLTVEGRVTDPSIEGGFEFETSLDTWIIAGVVDYTVEVLKRHVFPDGTLWVGTSGDSLYKAGKRWVWDSGAAASVDDDTVRHYTANGDGEIVHEPPTS